MTRITSYNVCYTKLLRQIGSSIIFPADPIGPEYLAFTSWDFAYATNNNDIIAKAQYSPIYYITYHNVSVSNNIFNPTSYTVESQDIILAEPNDSLGYYFGGWFTNAAFTDTVSVPAIVKGSTGDKEFYAKWETVSGISSIPATIINVYPNPTTGLLTLDFDTNKVQSLIITNISGQQVFKQTDFETAPTRNNFV